MKSNTRVILSLASICFVLVVALVSVIAAWAASLATVSGSVTVNFECEDVTCNVSATYQLRTASTPVSMCDTIKLTYETASGSFVVDKIELNTSDTYCTFAFNFANVSTTDEIKLDGYATIATNTSIAGYNSSSAGCYLLSWGTSTSSLTDISSGTSITSQTIGTSTSTETPDTSVTIYYRLTLNNFADSSQIKLTFNWTLTNLSSGT